MLIRLLRAETVVWSKTCGTDIDSNIGDEIMKHVNSDEQLEVGGFAFIPAADLELRQGTLFQANQAFFEPSVVQTLDLIVQTRGTDVFYCINNPPA